ncbi:MAG: DUF2339 domain-containing protein [Planctomycetes bacterium]|nr:DUF2339 domain-containing protein [Planctomycetota bacterium]
MPVPVPAPQPAPAPLPPPVPRVARPRIEWERWLGVRGAAVLGGIFLAIAGVLFFQYSIQQNWITVERRVVLGLIAGVAAMVGGQFARRREYEMAGNALTGAGAVILYAAFWGAHTFGVLPALVCFAGMAIVTASSCLISFRTQSQLVAWLGLTGGFATPLLLSSGENRPIGLFAYVLVLDLGFLFVAGKRRWPMLGLWGLVGTLGIEALWVVFKMEPRQLPIALVALGVFALLFVAASIFASRSERGRWVLSQASAVLVPFLFALYFASQSELGHDLWPLALLGGLLCAASIWLARAQGAALVPTGSAAGATAIALVWVTSRQLDAGQVWELAWCALALLAIFAFGREWRRSRPLELAERGIGDAWYVAVIGLAIAGVAASTRSEHVGAGPFVVLFTALGLALTRLGASRRLAWVSFAAAPLAVIGPLWWSWTHSEMLAGVTQREFEMLAALLLGVIFAALSWFGREGARSGLRGLAAGAWVAMLLSITLTNECEAPDGFGARIVLLLFAALGCFGASAASSWPFVLLTGFFCALGQLAAGDMRYELRETWNAELGVALLSIAVLGAWLPLSKQRWAQRRGAWVAAALLPLCFAPHVAHAIAHLQGSGGEAWIPVPFVVAELAIAAWLLRGAQAGSVLARGASWPLLAAIIAGAGILPLWAECEVPVAWSALAACGAAWLARRRNFTPAAITAVAGALVCTLAWVLDVLEGTFERHSHLLFDLHALEYLLPALALLAAGAMLARWQRMVCVIAGLLVALLWMTIEVHQAFAQGLRFELFWPRDEAREVAVSVSWAAYALVLLGFGMRRKQSGLRWASLVLLVVVIGKLFLLDLSELRGLYRVASFLGLAVSLLLVSFGYQRFVFRKPRQENP